MTNTRELITKNLNFFMEMRNISQAELARLVDVKPSLVSRWVNGIHTPDIERTIAICKVLKITLGQLFGEEEVTDISTCNQAIAVFESPRLQKIVDKLMESESNMFKAETTLDIPTVKLDSVIQPEQATTDSSEEEQKLG